MTNAELEAYQTLKVISATLRQINEALAAQTEVLASINENLTQTINQKGERDE